MPAHRQLVTKAIIPAAGRGTRLWPLSRNYPKELLPIGDRANIQIVIEEAEAAGIDEIAIITRSGKEALREFLDLDTYAKPLMTDQERRLVHLLERVQLHFVEQTSPLGLGDALTCAREFVGDDPFAVLLPDNLFATSDDALDETLTYRGYSGFEATPAKLPSVTQKLLTGYEHHPGAWLALIEVGINVPPPVNMAPLAYETMSMPDSAPGELWVDVLDIREKGALAFPSDNRPLGDLRGVGRGIFPAAYLDAIESLRGRIKGELDDIRPLAEFHGEGGLVYGYRGPHRHFDVGDFTGYLEAQWFFRG